MRIAVVEDDAGARAAITEMLREPHDPRPFARAEELVAEIGRGVAFEAVVTDVVLPGMSGIDLIRALVGRRLVFTAVLVTGYGTGQLELDGLDVEVLTKPFLIDELLAAVEREPAQPRAIVCNGSSASMARDVQSSSPS